jgi:Protein of unknown function (DUF2971)
MMALMDDQAGEERTTKLPFDADAWFNELFTPLEEERDARQTRLHDHRQELLFHYTDSFGLQGIVESQRLWASNALYLNDATELVHAQRALQVVLQWQREQARGEASATFIERGKETLLSEITDFLEVYVACFCENGDLLSQWRGYPPAGGGYSIGIGSRMLNQIASSVQFWQVIYDIEEQKHLVEAVIAPTVVALDALEDEHGKDVAVAAVPSCLQRASALLAEFAFCFKHHSFREEAEWRIVHVRSRLNEEEQLPVECRATATGFVPYVELALPGAGPFTGKLPIKEVVVGPTAHPELAEQAVGKLLKRHDYDSFWTTVRRSSIPLRV